MSNTNKQYSSKGFYISHGSKIKTTYHSRTLTFAMHRKETKENLCTITPKVVE
jgi:hypothetical protein